MARSTFFRLLDTPIDSKGADLLKQVALQNQDQQADKTFPATPSDFANIPGSPFAYWATQKIYEIFKTMPRLEEDGRIARLGDHPDDQNKYLRLSWEPDYKVRNVSRNWVPYQKGGANSPFYCDVPLVTDWDHKRKTYYGYYGRKGRSNENPSNYELFFRPGLTWPRRTNGFSPRVMPSGCVFADKGPVILVENDNQSDILALLTIINSKPFFLLLSLQLARTELAQSYEVGLIQQTPIPRISIDSQKGLIELAKESHDLARFPFTFDETTHVFRLPVLLHDPSDTLYGQIVNVANQETTRQAKIVVLQRQIDTRVAEMYGFGREEIESLSRAGSQNIRAGEEAIKSEEENEEDEEEFPSSIVFRPSSIASDLLMWCVGISFGRWDARFALNPDLLPALGGPFDPLPRCSPGMLVGPDGLPAVPGNIVSEAWHRVRPNVLSLSEKVDGPVTIGDREYPLPIAWDGILVDDPGHPRDIVTAVRRVLRLIWNESADEIEQEACQILKVPDLRTYFRDPRQFFAYHIKRYSKSRRKAPIYWLLQSAKRNYGVWLYYPRLNPDLLFHAGRDYVDFKITLENDRLSELQSAQEALSGAALKAKEKQVARQVDLVEEIKAFGKELDRVALLEIKPDLNDGVILNIAPLYNLIPWKDAEKAWKELASGKYEWSSIAKQIKGKK